MIETGGGAAPSTHDLTERLRHLLAGAPGVLVAYLYGSHARGQAGPLSDVDVALLLDGDDEEERRLELTAAIAHAVARRARTSSSSTTHRRPCRTACYATARSSPRASVPASSTGSGPSTVTSIWLRPGASWRPARGTGCVRAALVDAYLERAE